MTSIWARDLLDRLGDDGAWLGDSARPRRHVVLDARHIRNLTACLDAVQVIVASVIAALLLPGGASAVAVPEAAVIGLLAAIAAVAIRRALRTGDGTPLPEAMPPAAARSVIAVTMAILLTGMPMLIRSAEPRDIVDWIAVWLAIAAVGVVAIRVGAVALLARNRSAALGVAVIGDAERCLSIAQTVTGRLDHGWRLEAELDDTAPDSVQQLRALVARRTVQIVIIAIADGEDHRIGRICEALAGNPVRICLGVNVGVRFAQTPAASRRADRFQIIDLITDPHDGFRGIVKRCIDVCVSVAALIALLPVFALVALAIAAESPGPILFQQRRFGIGNVPIRVVKFRTMHAALADPSGSKRTASFDPRVTRVGRFLRRTSIDELPQLINVLRGEMSLVGPRPHALHMKVGDAYYFDAVARYHIRHRVKPGITGWAQVRGSRGEIDTLDKAYRRVELDLWYIQNWSLILDCRILLRTLFGGFLTAAD